MLRVLRGSSPLEDSPPRCEFPASRLQADHRRTAVAELLAAGHVELGDESGIDHARDVAGLVQVEVGAPDGEPHVRLPFDDFRHGKGMYRPAPLYQRRT